jgi:UDP-GlcNAc3NAcA epimerase
MTITHIVGNRPQFIKLSLLHRALQRQSGESSRIIHTGQHFNDNMSAVFFREFDIPAPDHQLQIHGSSHGEMIGRMLIELDRILAAENPGCVVVYGDTNTTLAGSLAAKKRNIPLMHVEAGIRTGKEDMPEEANRYVSDRLATLNFACTYLGVEQLSKEGMPPGRVHNTGDLMLDAVLLFGEQAKKDSVLPGKLIPDGRPFVLATIHRAENTDDPGALRRILQALNAIHSELPVVLPLHPRTRQAIEGLHLPLELITIPPVGYFDMLALLQASTYVITDSGGLSREAFFFCKPSVIVMEKPFWPELFHHGPSLAATADTAAILEKFGALRFASQPFGTGIFGDGHAADKICELILNHLNE